MDYLFLGICITIVVLILAQSVILRRKGNSGHWTYTASLLISALLLLIYIGSVVGVYYSDISWPHVGSKTGIFLFLLVPGILFQLFFIFSSLLKRKLPTRRIWPRLLSILLGLFLAAQFGQAVSGMAMQRFGQACHPLVAMIKKNMPSPCNPQTPYTDILPRRGENSTWYPGNSWHLYHNEQSFVLTFPGGSVDVDGSTIYYSSQHGEWTIFHNDSKEEKKQLQELLKGMQDCQERPGS